ncbi:LOW QUALITY PROTEIN: trypsin-like cysteine/serine peptidase domain-containing protein [Microdochium trichocladiopsis]|uniref:Trypsin-like cysteine/serine peptidase domain-containing protein n=1 Tax=Microdochium trichocladiopsis TaxID=1682393 RepID=A0A9P8Y5U8_9PEZI|nr:LOW QUALITY PROTEIN: trypsin-like cysteine/serine peptidase domain-containing protein [Microdochium trichocladiopsis]KAH7032625.1 LOW QUALITY PROTEIN: trypsin-like cysteine/serine peptidase domain-containing protein [Microdochium trichocladiopsis]
MLALTKLAAVLAVLPAIASAAPTTKPFPVPEARDEVDEGTSIVGGEAASAGDFPFIVSLSQGGSHFCGGVLLNANTVITAAHCSVGQSASSVRVRAGSLNRNSGGTQVGVSRILVHPSYNSGTTDNDVALWRLSTAIPTSSTIGYVTLPAQGSDPAAGSSAVTAGWGTTSEGSGSLPTALRKVTVPVVSRATCQAAYGASSVTTSMICAGLAAGGKDSCQGDSGGPIVDSSKTLIGLVSWGDGCARPNAYGVYTRIGQFVTWINTNKS